MASNARIVKMLEKKENKTVFCQTKYACVINEAIKKAGKPPNICAK